jgi:hypothetical protein
MTIKLISLRFRRASLKRVLEGLEYNRNAIEEMPCDADVIRLREKATICLLKVQELQAEIVGLIEKLEVES